MSDKNKKIKVKRPKIVMLDYRKIKGLQGDLKILDDENLARLKRSFETNGFFVSKKVWLNPEDNEYYYLDGHQTDKYLNQIKPILIKADGKRTWKIPCEIIEADSMDDAKKKLLVISSQYGTITRQGLQDFIVTFEDEDDISEMIVFDNINDEKSDVELDDFFEEKESEAVGFKKIILEYSDDEYELVMDALKRKAPTPEQAVWILLSL